MCNINPRRASPSSLQGKLTKAQRKNLKRAEKKKRATTADANSSLGIGEAMSVASSDQDHIAQAEQESLMYDLCIQAMVAFKTLRHVEQLQRLGFAEGQCLAAVQRYLGFKV